MVISILSYSTLLLSMAKICVLGSNIGNSAEDLILKGLEALGGESALNNLHGVTYHSPGCCSYPHPRVCSVNIAAGYFALGA